MPPADVLVKNLLLEIAEDETAEWNQVKGTANEVEIETITSDSEEDKERKMVPSPRPAGGGKCSGTSSPRSSGATPAQRARELLQQLPHGPYHEDRPDSVLLARSARPTRRRLQGRKRDLPENHVYIGRGSAKFGLPPTPWANPFAIGRDGDRLQCLTKFKEYLLADGGLQAQLGDLRGKVLVCHCGPTEDCHADILITEYVAMFEEALEAEDATSEEDEHGNTKAKKGAGWLGRGDPLPVGRGVRHRGLRDGGGLCSPGRWPPWRREFPPLGVKVAKVLDEILDEAAVTLGKDFEIRLVSSLACGRVDSDPLRGLDLLAKRALEALLGENGFVRDERAEHPGKVIDFELLGALAAALGDPDAQAMDQYRSGVRLGYRRRLPRTRAVWERKKHWPNHVGADVAEADWVANYSSAALIAGQVEDTFEEHEAQGMMLSLPLAEARKLYGDRLRVAALGAVGPAGEERVIHDATHGVGVNAGIRVRDLDEAPLHGDLSTALAAESQETGSKLFGLIFDISKAHRRVPIAPIDWGLQACSTLRPHQEPTEKDLIWLNLVGTYGLGSASFSWNRVGALLLRILHYVVGKKGLRWAFRFADDFLVLARADSVVRPLAMTILLVRALGFPLKWVKFRGGTKLEYVGYFLDLEKQEIGMSDRRCAWASRWCREAALASTIQVKNFREAVGRLAFSAGPLVFLRPSSARCTPGARSSPTSPARRCLPWFSSSSSGSPTSSPRRRESPTASTRSSSASSSAPMPKQRGTRSSSADGS